MDYRLVASSGGAARNVRRSRRGIHFTIASSSWRSVAGYTRASAGLIQISPTHLLHVVLTVKRSDKKSVLRIVTSSGHLPL